MPTARCKFTVTEVTHYGYGGRQVKLMTQYDPTLPEDQAFTKATPQGEMSVRIDNPAVFPVFEPGNVVYIDVSVVPAKSDQVG